MAYKLKIGPAQGLKLKGNSGFALPMIGRTGITATKTGGIWYVDLDYTVLTPGPISDPTTAYVAIEDKTGGIYREVSLASLLTSGLDADLQAIAALTSTGVLVRTADNTWALRTVTGTANEITVTNGGGVAGAPTLSLPSALTFTGKTVTGGTFNSPALVTPALGTPASGVATNLTGLPISSGVSGLATGIATFLATPSSANLRSALTDEVGTGAAYFVGGALGTPASGIATNLTGLPLTTGVTGTLPVANGGIGATTISSAIDTAFSSTQGSVLYRGASGWAALSPGTSGNFLKTLGAAANPTWAAVPGGGDLLSTNNLSDVASAATSRTNLGAFGKIVVQKFTASGTYTPSANLIYAQIECVGGGGGGGGASGTVSNVYAGGGGGSGSYSRAIASATTIGASQSVTIGTAGAGGVGAANGSSGGDSSIGALCIGKGGGGGAFGSSAIVPTGGSGGVAGTGDITTIGAPGLPGIYNSLNTGVYSRSGTGGSSYFGGGAPGGSGAGNTATGYGGGGSGALVFNSATTATGGAGFAGYVVITEYCSS